MIITHIIKLYNGTQILSCDYYSMLLISKLQLSIGSPYQTVLASIDLFLPFSFIRSDLFDLSRSSTIEANQSTILNYDNKTYHAVLYSDLTNIEAKEFTPSLYGYVLYIINRNKSDTLIDNGYGFAFKHHNESFSLVHQLKQNVFIDRAVFALYLDEPTLNKGTIYFGGVPQEVIEHKNKLTCKVSDEYTPWGCMLNAIIVNNDIININRYSFFQSNEQAIIFPHDIMLRIISSPAIQYYITKGICEFREDSSWSYVNCFQSSFYPNNKIEMYFTFDNKGYRFTIDELFYCTPMVCSSNFYSVQSKYGDMIIFGNAFLNKYVAEFDYDEKTVSFYSDYTFKTFTQGRSSKMMLMINSIYLCCFLIIQVIIYIKNK